MRKFVLIFIWNKIKTVPLSSWWW